MKRRLACGLLALSLLASAGLAAEDPALPPATPGASADAASVPLSPSADVLPDYSATPRPMVPGFKTRRVRKPHRKALEIAIVADGLGSQTWGQSEIGLQFRLLRVPLAIGLTYLSVPGNARDQLDTVNNWQTETPYSGPGGTWEYIQYWSTSSQSQGSVGPNPDGVALSPKYLLRTRLGEFSLGGLVGLDGELLPVNTTTVDLDTGKRSSSASSTSVLYFLLGLEASYRIPVWQGIFFNAGARVLWQTCMYDPPNPGWSTGWGTDEPGYRVATVLLQLGYGFNL